MIRRISGVLPALVQRDVFGTRTAGYYKTYGTERNGAAFYAQETDGNVMAVLSDAFLNGSLTVDDGADFAELAEFVRFLGLRTLLCSANAAKALQFPSNESGSVMRYIGTEQNPDLHWTDVNDPAFSFHDVYDLLTGCGFALGGYDAWFSDFALRVRRGTADVRCIMRDGVLASTASVLFQSDDAVYLGAVGTDAAFRGQGLAGALVLSLAQCGKRAEILCKPHRISFYEQLGFQKIGEFSLCHFSK